MMRGPAHTVHNSASHAHDGRAEGALRMAKAMLDTVNDGIVTIEPSTGRVVDCNPRFLAMFARARASHSGALHLGHLCAEGGDGTEGTLLDHLRSAGGDTPPLFQCRMRRADGSSCWTEWSARHIDIAGQVHFVASVRDITQRKQAEEELLRIREALDDCGSAVVMLDGRGRVDYINAAFGGLFGYTHDQVGSIDFRALFVEGALIADILEAVIAGGQWDGELDMAGRRGRTFPALLRITPVLDEDFEVTGVLCILNDITERKHLEAQLMQAQNLKSIGQLAAGIAHEINTPTQYVSDNTRFFKDCCGDLFRLIDCYEALEDCARRGDTLDAALEDVAACREAIDLSYLRDDMPRAISQTLEGVERVGQIAGAMRQFTHGGEDKKLIDVNKAIEATVTIARSEWKYVAELETDLEPALPAVPCIPGAINQVLLNLIVNAAHAIGEKGGPEDAPKGRITLETRGGEGYVEIRIRDTGTGIPEAARGRVFEPFFTTKEVGKGTGQGLAISHAVVVEKHGGTLTFESETGVGTTFLVRLPVCPPEGVPE